MAQSMDLAFRTATLEDLDRVAEIHLTAFPDPRPVSARLRHLQANALGPIDRMVVATVDDTIVAHAFLFELEMFYGGVPVKTGGIASVGVAPEHRERGIATQLLAQLHRNADVEGKAITFLYGFRHRFYTRLGYATGTSRQRLEIDPRSIPKAWRGELRFARGVDRAAIERCYERAARETTAWMKRPLAIWDRFFSRERRQILVTPDHSGYVAFELRQEEDHGPITAVVEELVANDPKTRRTLWGALGTLSAQVHEIEIDVALDDPIVTALDDPDGRRHGDPLVEHGLGTVVGGPMVRIEDVTRAFEARGYRGEGSFDVVIEDEVAMSVTVENGRATVAEARGKAAFQTTRRGLAAVLYGGLSARDAVALGLAEADPRTLDRIDPIVRLPPLMPLDPF